MVPRTQYRHQPDKLIKSIGQNTLLMNLVTKSYLLSLFTYPLFIPLRVSRAKRFGYLQKNKSSLLLLLLFQVKVLHTFTSRHSPCLIDFSIFFQLHQWHWSSALEAMLIGRGALLTSGQQLLFSTQQTKVTRGSLGTIISLGLLGNGLQKAENTEARTDWHGSM